MNARTRSYALLGGTLVIGMVLGALLVGALGQVRAGKIEGMRHEDAFVRELERIIQPRDEAQREAIRPLLEATARGNDARIRDFNDDMRRGLEIMVRDLTPLLDDDQIERLQRFADRPPPPGPGGPGGPGRRPPRKKKRS